MKNIVLIGYMGTGKTEVGKLLAGKLKMSYVDTDAIIEKEQGKTINEIFDKQGEPAFRDMESAAIDSIANIQNSVISTGGGIVLKPENVEKLKKIGKLIHLKADPEVIFERLKNLNDRPLLKVKDPMSKIRGMLRDRVPIYQRSADHEIDTTRLSPDDACNRMIGYLKKG